MKNLVLLLSFSILFQSCFSYKTVDYNSIPIEKKQKVEVEGVAGTYNKGTLVSKDETTMVLEHKGGTQTILAKDIYEVKVVKFSVLKTAGGIVKAAAWVAAASGILILIALSKF